MVGRTNNVLPRINRSRLSFSGNQISLIDDGKPIRNSFVWEHRAEGFNVTTAASGSEAIDEVGRAKHVLGGHRHDDARR